MGIFSSGKPHGIVFSSIVAVLFGVLTIWSGGSVLFVDGSARVAAGSYTPFVLWFNFLSGFAYVLAGVGMFQRKDWAVKLSILIAAAIVIVFMAFAGVILSGAEYEQRTVGAMVLRSTVWLTIAWYISRTLNRVSI